MEFDEVLFNGFKNKNGIIDICKSNEDIYNNLKILYNLINDNIFLIEEKKLISIISNKKRLDDCINIIKYTNKVNILENPTLTEDFIDQIVPNFDIKYVSDLLKFETSASDNIINMIKKNELSKVKKIIDFFTNNFELSDDNKLIHLLFNNYSNFESLFDELIKSDLSKDEIMLIKDNLFDVIFNDNLYNISQISDLSQENYKMIEKKHIDDLVKNNDASTLKRSLFRYFTVRLDKFYCDDPIVEMKYYLKFYRLDEICEDIRNVAIENIKREAILKDCIVETNEKLSKCMFTNEERMFLITIQNIIKCNDTETINFFVEEIKNLSNVSTIFKNIVDKTRYLFNLEMNMSLSSNLEKLEGKKEVLENGVEIIEPSGNFNFLCHTIYGYDDEHSSFVDSIINDPSLWYKLDGSSTISTSSISNRNISILGKDEYGVKHVTYLFNKTPDNFLLAMDTQDLNFKHSNNKFHPKFESSFFTTLDGLNFQTSKSGYNEVAGWRNGMTPCAIACLDDEPSEEQIKAALFFKVPIIKFNPYLKRNLGSTLDQFEEYKSTLSVESLSNYIFNNVGEYELDQNQVYNSRIKNVIDYLLKSFKTSVKTVNIDEMDFIEQLRYKKDLNEYHNISREELIVKINELEKLICQIYNNDLKEIYMKIISIRYSLSEMLQLTDQEIATMEYCNSSSVIIEKDGEKILVSTEVDNYDIKTNASIMK